MTFKPRTIDNLGIDASIRYAKDQQVYEAQFLQDAQIIPKRIEVPVSTPYTPTEFDQIFHVAASSTWASFQKPPTLHLVEATFSHELIPSLHMETLDNYEELLTLATPPEDPIAQSQKEKLTHLLSCITTIDKSLELVHARRNQYQRG